LFPDAIETSQAATLFFFDFITEFDIVAQNVPHPGIDSVISLEWGKNLAKDTISASENIVFLLPWWLVEKIANLAPKFR
jgi:hypothetical protein